jgi:hypothetical protein
LLHQPVKQGLFGTAAFVAGPACDGFAEGEANDEKGRAVCRAVGTYLILRVTREGASAKGPS